MSTNGILPHDIGVNTICQSRELGRIVARLRIGRSATSGFVEADTRVNVGSLGIAAEQRSIVLGIRVETHVIALVFTLCDDLSRAIGIEGDVPLTVGIKRGLRLQVVATAACGIQITTFDFIEEGPCTSIAAEGDLEHVGFACGICSRSNGNGITIFAHNHSVTIVCLLVTHSKNAQVVVMGHDKIVGSSLKP